MADVHSKETRSYNMSRIRGKDTGPEIVVRKFLFAKGFRYRLYDKRLPGKPDIVLPKYKTVIFIHGCFWHGHQDCRYFTVPKSNTEWWLNKIHKNQQNDLNALSLLQAQGYKVITVWGCQLKKKQIDTTLQDLIITLQST
ncbi:DNA mismatch endonuclease Vsr [Mucilaginibacter sp. dw_454]|uniref:very short patch repair endonuclease n=1 Tax=Mucilaginibacter sp. dw_454 TaxID=2720079 RepID=UPI001BD466C6|nr:DNA mismatch endonuclease Vsr [Mucilaginibacter sp. dw_454]